MPSIQDAQELLSWLFESLHEETGGADKKKNDKSEQELQNSGAEKEDEKEDEWMEASPRVTP